MNTKKWTYKKFLKYILPSVLSMIYISLFIIVDGFFVSNYVGTEGLAAINIVHPIYNLTLGIAVMFSIGGSALISIALGKKQLEQARNDFSLISLFIVITITLISTMLSFNIERLLFILGVNDTLYEYAFPYGKIIIITMPFLALKINYEFFLRVDNKANYSLILTIIGGTINIILDYYFVKVLCWGIVGAGYATFIGILIPVILGAHYFFNHSQTLRYIWPRFKPYFLIQVSFNGLSEMVTEFSCAITTALFNIILLKYSSVKAIAANAVIMHIFSLYIAIIFGINLGIQPSLSYHFGSENFNIIKRLVKYSIMTINFVSIIFYFSMNIWGEHPIQLFLSKDHNASSIALSAIPFFSFSFLIAGINIFSSSYFTAINNGKHSAIISLARSIVFLVPLLLVLPKVFGLKGIWIVKPLVEAITLSISLYFISKDDVLWSKEAKVYYRLPE